MGLKRTIENSRDRVVSRSPGRGAQARRLPRDRSRSPLGRARSPVRGAGGRGYDYDDPRALLERDQELYKKRQREQEMEFRNIQTDRTMASRLEGGGGGIGVSPLQVCHLKYNTRPPYSLFILFRELK